MKRIVALFLSIGLALGSVLPANAQDAFNPDTLPAPQNSGVFQIGETGVNVNYSTLGATSKDGQDQWVCESTTDPECASSKVSFIRGEGIIPICEDEKDTDCVESLEISLAGQEFVPAVFDRYSDVTTYPENPRVNFFEQKAPSLWSVSDATKPSGVANYAVIVNVSQTWDPRTKKFTTEKFFANVFPYREQEGNYEKPYSFTLIGENPVTGRVGKSLAGGGGGYDCGWVEQGRCGVVQEFDAGTKVRLSFRVSKEVGGWIQGRLKDPSISVRNFSQTHNEITVEAEPAVVQRMRHVVEDAKKITAKEKQLVMRNGFAGSWDGFATWASASSPDTFEFLSHFKSKTKDTAAGKNTLWNLASNFAPGQGSPCLSDTSKVLGIVTTNAMVYDGGVPKFSRGFLDYKVAGLHYEADGVTEVMGSYDLVMRSDVARCLYKFSKAPVSATITISGEGDKNIATTVVSERGGWLKLAAYDFTFSQKTIKVKLTQKKQTTITCVAPGKKSQKVTAANPKCPKGFRKR